MQVRSSASTIPSPEDVRALLDVAEPAFRAFVAVSAFAGLRLGEAAALRALGHAKPTTTLETYSHLWPSAEDRTRGAAALLAGDVLDARVGKTWAGGDN